MASNSDNYEFAKSSTPQGVDAYSCFTDKDFNFVNDINSGVYSNNSGLSLVQFDLSSIYNSGGFSDTTDMFLALPVVMAGAYAKADGSLIAPGAGSSALVTMKSNYQNMIHQIEVVSNGKVVSDSQPFVNVLKNLNYFRP